MNNKKYTLKKIGSNSTCDYWRLYVYYNDQILTAESGFLYYTKKEITEALKNKIQKQYNITL